MTKLWKLSSKFDTADDFFLSSSLIGLTEFLLTNQQEVIMELRLFLLQRESVFTWNSQIVWSCHILPKSDHWQNESGTDFVDRVRSPRIYENKDHISLITCIKRQNFAIYRTVKLILQTTLVNYQWAPITFHHCVVFVYRIQCMYLPL